MLCWFVLVSAICDEVGSFGFLLGTCRVHMADVVLFAYLHILCI